MMTDQGGARRGGMSEGFRSDPIARGLIDVVGEIGLGGRLPSERLLADRLGVSRTALRDRLQLLEAFGVLRRVTGSGTYVQALAPEGLAFALDIGTKASGLDLPSLHSVRVGLERQAAIEAAIKRHPVLQAHMRQQVLAMERATEPEELDRADLAFHAALFEASENQALVFFSQALVHALRESILERRHRMRELAHDRELMVNTHNSIHRAVESGSPAAAAAAVDAHFSAFQQATDPVGGWPADVTARGKTELSGSG